MVFVQLANQELLWELIIYVLYVQTIVQLVLIIQQLQHQHVQHVKILIMDIYQEVFIYVKHVHQHPLDI